MEQSSGKVSRDFKNIAVIIIISALVGVILYLLVNQNRTVEQQTSSKPMSLLNVNGNIDPSDPDAIAKMREAMDESNVPVNINAVSYIKEPGAPANWLIENPEGSNKNLLVEIFLLNKDGSIGEKIYETKGLLPPSSHISCVDKNTGETLDGYDYPDVKLDSGEYKAVAHFSGYTTESDPFYIGMAKVFIDVIVG